VTNQDSTVTSVRYCLVRLCQASSIINYIYIYIYTVPTEPNLTTDRTLSELRGFVLWVRFKFAFRNFVFALGPLWVCPVSALGPLWGSL
jgi:hypothetical protein